MDNEYRWLRFCYKDNLPTDDKSRRVYFLQALRNDGQLFAAWLHTQGANLNAIHRELRLYLETKINDPQAPPYTDEETGEVFSSQVHLDYGKNEDGWIEAV